MTRYPVLVLAVIVFVTSFHPVPASAAEDSEICGTEPGLPLSGGGLALEPDDTLRGLFIFARFRDDNRADWGNDWPIDPAATTRDAVPQWAASLFEDTGGTGTPSIDGSLAHYWHYMSRGMFRFDSAYYDSVVVLDSTLAEYNDEYGASLTTVNYVRKKVIAEVGASGFDFQPFINNYPGAPGKPDTLDYVCVIFRGLRTFTTCTNNVGVNPGALGQAWVGDVTFLSSAAGESLFAASHLSSWVASQGSRIAVSDYPNPPSVGAYQCTAPCDSCGVQSVSLEAYRQNIAHEMGHAFFLGLGSDAFNHFYSPNDWCIMHSNGRGNIMHGYERLLLGWIEPIDIYEGTPASIKLYDSVTRNAPDFSGGGSDSTYYRIYPDASDTSQYFLLENRRASTVYTESWEASSSFTGIGQPGAGLLITHINQNAPIGTLGIGLDKRATIEPAYGTFDVDYEPNPAHGRSRTSGNVGCRSVASAEEPFGLGNANTFAPYTCPNTNLYDSSDTTQTVYSGLAILEIAGQSDSSMTAEIRWGQPADRTAGNVTWEGQVILTDDFTVADGDTVTVSPATSVLFARDPGTAGQGVDATRIEFIVAGDGLLDLDADEIQGDLPSLASARDTTLRKGPKPDGTLVFEDCLWTNTAYTVTLNPTGISDWYGLRLPSLANLDIEAATVKHARSAVAMETNEFVNPSRFEGSHRLTLVDNYNKLSFDRDVVVPQDSTFVLFSGFTLGFAADRDEGHLAGLGRLPDKAELIVQGAVDFRGNNYYDRVIIRSDDPDATDAQKLGDWGGMVLLPFPADSNCADTRDLDFTLFRDAVHGIVPVDTCFMKMNWPLFENNDSSDIYLDRDVVIREGIQVDLRAPTRFLVEAGSSAVDLTGGEPGKVDFIVRGKLVGRRPGVVSPSEWIWFESTDKDSLNGDDYGGLVFDWTSSGSVLEDADIGWAVNPVFLYYPDSLTTIQGCRIHHAQDKGVWVYGTMGVGAVIETCTIERGVGLRSNIGPNIVGGTLVRLDYTDDLRFERNKLDLSGLSVPVGSAALDAYFGKIHCLTSSGQTDSLIIRKNWVVGPGTGQEGGRRGVRAFWLCGSTSRKILLDENYVQDFRTAAFEFNQSSDTQVNCNTTLGNRRVVDLYRDASATGPGVRFKSNWLEVTEPLPTEVVRTDDNVKTKLGPHQSTMGDNGLMVERQNVNFIRENDPNAGDKLDARDCYWYLFTAPSGPEELISDPLDSFEITNRIVPSAIDVLYGPFYTDDANPLYCRADTVPTGGAAALPVRQEAVVEGRAGPPAAALEAGAGELPSETFLAARDRHTAGATVTFDVGIALGDEGTYVLDIFDVRGRRIARLIEGPLQAGTYRATWKEARASGVYFARLKGDALTKIRKVVVLR
jgi:hypothetical protein